MRQTHKAISTILVLIGIAFWSEIIADPPPDKVLPNIVRTFNERGIPKFVYGDLGKLKLDVEHSRAAERFLQRFTLVEMGAAGDEEFVTRHVLYDERNNAHARIIQTIRGLQVVGASLIVHSTSGGRVFAVNGDFITSRGLARNPQISATDAMEQAISEAGIDGERTDQPELVYVLGFDGKTYLAWQEKITYYTPEGLGIDLIFADALSGKLVARHPQVRRAKAWQTYNYLCPDSYELKCSNSQTCTDLTLREIHDNASLTYNFYKTRFNRNSWNGSDATVKSAGHHILSCSGGGDPPNNPPNGGSQQALAQPASNCNAYWTPPYMEFGDCDGVQYSPLGGDLDWVVHEFTHAVTDQESGLVGYGESGAIGESMSDIFAAGADAFFSGNVGAHVWQIAEDSKTPGISGDAARYMANPTLEESGLSTDFYPERYTGANDFGGVHYNAGIINLAFYLLSQGGSHPRGKTTIQLEGIGIDKALDIYYYAQRYWMTASTKFSDMPDIIQGAAYHVLGGQPCPVNQWGETIYTLPEYSQVRGSFCAVGLNYPGGASCDAIVGFWDICDDGSDPT